MPDNDPKQPLEPDEDALNQGGNSDADGGEERANSADSGKNAQPESSTTGDLAYVDRSLSKIDKLSAAMAKLSKASADQAFCEKVKELVKEADEVDSDSQAEPEEDMQSDLQQDSTDDEVDKQATAPEPEVDPEPSPAKIILNRVGLGGISNNVLWLRGNNFHSNMRLSVASACDSSIHYSDVKIARLGPSKKYPEQDLLIAPLEDFIENLSAKGSKLKITLSDENQSSSIFIEGTCK